MKYLCWNFRGMGNPRTVQTFLHRSRKYHPDVLFISETLGTQARLDGVKTCLGFQNAFSVDSIGRSRGLEMLWKEDFDFRLLTYSQHHIMGEIWRDGSVFVTIIGFYGWPVRGEKWRS